MDKKYLLRVVGYIALALAAVILIVDIAYQMADALVESVETLPVTTVKEEQLLTAEGYIVRTEQPLAATAEGLLSHTVVDGTKVAAGDQVAEIYGGNVASAKLEELRNAQHRQTLLEEAKAQKSAYSQTAADREIARLRAEIDRLTAEGTTQGLSSLSDALQIMLYIRELKTGRDLSEVEEALETQVDSLRQEVGGALSSVKADRSGYYFSACDGYESYLTVDDLKTADPTALRALLSGDTQAQSTAGTAGKIVTDYNWGIVMEVSFREAQGLSEGETYSVLLSGFENQHLSMKLDRLILEYGGKTGLLVFTCTKMPDGFSYSRHQSVSVVLSETEGIRIPVGALRQLNGVIGVYVLRGSVVEFREVSPIVLADGIVLADIAAEPTGEYPMLSYYDVLIVRGKELYVGRIIDQ